MVKACEVESGKREGGEEKGKVRTKLEASKEER
jgi:hypothetical protein